MDRKELITSPEFVICEMDWQLYSTVGQTPGNIDPKIKESEYCEKSSQIRRLVEICIANGFIPVLKLVPVDEYLAEDERKAKEVKNGK